MKTSTHINRISERGKSRTDLGSGILNMAAKKRQFYRNWYQEWKREEEEEALKQLEEMTKYENSLVDRTQYRANHELSRQYANGGKPSSSSAKAKGTIDLSLSGENTGADIVRGLLIGLPLVLVLVTILYTSGVIPPEKIQGLFGISTVSPVEDYLTQYDELMTLHNNINYQLTAHLKAGDFSESYKQELQTLQQTITDKTNALSQTSDQNFSNLNQLLSYKLLSLNKMIDLILNHQELSTEVSSYYDQFVTDQNQVGTQIVSALTGVLDQYKVGYTKQVNGSIQIK